MNKKERVLKVVIGVLSLLIVIGIGFLLSRIVWTAGTEDEGLEPEQEENGTEQPTEEPAEEPGAQLPTLPMFFNGNLELPVIGAAGYISVEEGLYDAPEADASLLANLQPGTPFEIRDEAGDWWLIRTEQSEGWIQHEAAFINLPDVIPSIVYDHTNSYDSLFKSSYIDIPDVTGEALSNMTDFNDRLEETEYIFPMLYSSAQKVFYAQQLAMLNGETLVVYESYRSQENSRLIRESLSELIEENEEVEAGVNQGPWSIGWFIHSSISNHNRGAAVDLTLANVNEVEEKVVGDFVVREVTDFDIYEMQTPFHELSADSVLLSAPIAAMDRDGWRKLGFHEDVTEATKRLVDYMDEAGLTPVASEWWHFNDLDAIEALGADASIGNFDISTSINSQPSWEDIEHYFD